MTAPIQLGDKLPDDPGPMCDATRRSRRAGYVFQCTRPVGHDGDHAAGGVGHIVLAIWPRKEGGGTDG